MPQQDSMASRTERIPPALFAVRLAPKEVGRGNLSASERRVRPAAHDRGVAERGRVSAQASALVEARDARAPRPGVLLMVPTYNVGVMTPGELHFRADLCQSTPRRSRRG